MKDFHRTDNRDNVGVFSASGTVGGEVSDTAVTMSEPEMSVESDNVVVATSDATAVAGSDTLAVVASNVEDQGVRVTLDDDNRIVLTGSGEKTFNIRLTSPSGSLIPLAAGGSPRPMQFALSNTPHDVVLGSLGMPMAIKGSITLDVRWNAAGGKTDLRVQYGIEELLDAVVDLNLG